MTAHRRGTVLVLGLLCGAAWAQVSPPSAEPAPPVEPAPPPQPIPDAPPAAVDAPAPAAAPALPDKPPLFPRPNVTEDVYFGAHAAVNIGLLALDLHVRRSYTFIAGNLGVPLVSNGDLGAFSIGSGYSLPLSPPDESMWVLDLFGLVTPGWQSRWDPSYITYARYPFVGLGVGVGFRYLHWSGFTFGIKAPIFGAAINGGPTTSDSVVTFYYSSVIGMPVISFGLRW